VSGILDVSQKMGNGQYPTYLYNLSTVATNLYRIITYPAIGPQENDNCLNTQITKAMRSENKLKYSTQITGIL
jgi:hypothetical protein